MPPQKFTILQLSTVFLLSVGMMNHVQVIPLILDVAARDSWLSILLTTALFIPVFLTIGYIIKKTGQQDIRKWLTKAYGRWASVAFSAAAGVLLTAAIIITTKDMSIWTNASYMPNTPMGVIVVSFLATALYTAMKGLRTLVATAGIFLPIIVLLGEFVMMANFQIKDYSLLFPIFEYGPLPMWKGVMYIGAGFVELIFLVFMQHQVSSKVGMWQMLILGLLLAGLTLGPTMGAISAFGPIEAAQQRNAAFEQWRLVKVGNYMEHVDFLSIFQWVGGAFVRIALALYIVRQFVPSNLFLVGITALCAIGALYPVGDITFYNFMKNGYYPLMFAGLLALVAVLYILVLISAHRKRGTAHE
ncbi:spore germination protein (amino acid permease) [Paenibacillus sp. UNCCL117]|uniref:GerAB/ArcD/ProY family transporter n=1 Tax=unclassified Paenibacillus TaxID=185978 RepID=UPI00088C83BF|nr:MULTISPECIES: endospore germination permease [unclassified Paenibacillus]SDD97246.1 spore germination protein (amino acid permease) [Paenibacillus sp. cl123]SFW56230.1 spore germination protein (amino acid permease) [Paenibacillus sp. UNCCL117]